MKTKTIALVGCGRIAPRHIEAIAATPGRQKGYMSRYGHILKNPDAEGVMKCPESGFRYKESSTGILTCIDLHEEAPLFPPSSIGIRAYSEFK